MVQTKEELRLAKSHGKRRVVAQANQATMTQNPMIGLSPRLQKILEIIRANPIVTQQELAERLTRCGFASTASSVWRDIIKLGLKKSGGRYLVPQSAANLSGPVTDTDMALQVAQVAAERLPPRLRRELAERLLASAAREQRTVTVRLLRLPRSKQSRLAKLLDKNTDGKLTKAERAELKKLGKEVDETTLSNSMALARAARPELFGEKGDLVKSRFRQAYGSVSTEGKGSRREIAHR